MNGLTPDILAELKAPFKIEDHELRQGSGKMLVYLTEEPLSDRLTEIDINWQFRIISTIVTDYNLTRPDSITVSAELTLCGITRGGVGAKVAKVTKKDRDGKFLAVPIIQPLDEKELKGAATDALKRCARQFGVGAYLLRTGEANIRNENDFRRWYKREFGGETSPPPSPAPRPVAAERAQPARESTPAAIDDALWTRNENGEVVKFVKWAEKTWAETGVPTKSISNTYNRIAQLLKLGNVAGKRDAFYNAMLSYEGSKDDAADAVRGYVEPGKASKR
jgi:hypothetical protein